MEVAIVILAAFSIGFGLFGFVMQDKFFSSKKELNELRAELEHAERDENLRAEILKEVDKRVFDCVFSSVNAHEMDFHD